MREPAQAFQNLKAPRRPPKPSCRLSRQENWKRGRLWAKSKLWGSSSSEGSDRVTGVGGAPLSTQGSQGALPPLQDTGLRKKVEAYM